MDAESIRIETDEGGFWLVVGYEPQRFHIDDPEALYDHVKAAIGPWLYEREQAFAEFRQAVKSGTGPAAAFVCRDEDIDESGGLSDPSWDEAAYEITDPKHPRYHSTHVDLWDARADK